MKKTCDIVSLGLAVIMSIVLASISRLIPQKNADAPRWRIPGIELPESQTEITGVYVRKGVKMILVVKVPIIFLAYDGEDAAGRYVHDEYWFHDDGVSDSYRTFKRPLYWVPRCDGKELPAPSIPNLLARALAK